MDDPMKIIWKYKNNNKRIQYNVFIFIGDLNKDLNKILMKIKDLNLYNSFLELDINDYKKLKKNMVNYGILNFFSVIILDILSIKYMNQIL